MKISTTHPSGQTPNNTAAPATPVEIAEFTQRMIGGLAPYLCFGVARHQAWLRASIIGATPDHDRCVRAATRHLQHTDPADEAAAVIHAGMLFVAALKAGIHPEDAGSLVDESIGMLLPIGTLQGEPPADY